MRPLVLLLVLAAGACSAPSSPSAQPTPLANTFESAAALGQAVLAALEAQDRPRLEALALSEAEFRTHAWPELPASRPERNLPFDYAWRQMKQNSDGSLTQILHRYGGKQYRLASIRFTGETSRYASFTVMRESEVVAADEGGREWILRLFGSVMVKNDRYKLFSYVVDD